MLGDVGFVVNLPSAPTFSGKASIRNGMDLQRQDHLYILDVSSKSLWYDSDVPFRIGNMKLL